MTLFVDGNTPLREIGRKTGVCINDLYGSWNGASRFTRTDAFTVAEHCCRTFTPGPANVRRR
jgi:hypothetical protein